MSQRETVSIRSDFRRVQGLGADLPCLLVAKRTSRSEEFMHRQLEVEQQPRLERYLQPLREEIGEGSISLTTLRAFASGEPPIWEVFGPEPHDVIYHDEALWGAFCGSLRAMDPPSGRLLRSIHSERLTNLHSLSALPGGDCLLATNTGLDELVEINIASGDVGWSWRPSDHGWNTGPFGVPIVSSGEQARALGLTPVDAATARSRLKAGTTEKGWAIHADLSATTHPLGLEKWQRVAEPNWAGYDDGGATILCTAFCGDAAFRLDRQSGKILQIQRGYRWPHGVIPSGADDYLVTDTGRGTVHFVGKDLRSRQAYSFTEPGGSSGEGKQREWLQFTNPFASAGTFATVDASRSRILVWSRNKRIYSEYPVPRSILVKLVKPAPAGAIQL